MLHNWRIEKEKAIPTRKREDWKQSNVLVKGSDALMLVMDVHLVAIWSLALFSSDVSSLIRRPIILSDSPLP